jgi:transcriptional regulator with XRE-family HTH domain
MKRTDRGPMTADELRALRESWGWSQTQLAEALGVSQGAVSRMESGDRPILQRTALALETIRTQREPEEPR